MRRGDRGNDRSKPSSRPKISKKKESYRAKKEKSPAEIAREERGPFL